MHYERGRDLLTPTIVWARCVCDSASTVESVKWRFELRETIRKVKLVDLNAVSKMPEKMTPTQRSKTQKFLEPADFYGTSQGPARY